MREIVLDITRQLQRRSVAALALLAHRLERDPFQLAAQLPDELLRVGLSDGGDRVGLDAESSDSGAGARRLDVANDPPDFRIDRLGELRAIERRRAAEQLVQQRAQ